MISNNDNEPLLISPLKAEGSPISLDSCSTPVLSTLRRVLGTITSTFRCPPLRLYVEGESIDLSEIKEAIDLKRKVESTKKWEELKKKHKI